MGDEVPLSPKIQQTIEQVMADLKLPDNVRNIIKPFSGFGFDLFHAGTLNAKYGAILSIPINFTSTEEYLRAELQINEEPVDWSRNDAKVLLKMSLLSENAQKFAIANEILRIQAEEPYYNSIRLALIIAVLWTLYNAITYRFKLRERNVLLCRTLYSVFPVIGTISWFGIKDYYSYHLDCEHNKILCDMGAEYIKGGQEFYDKTVMRNRALRSLLGKTGENIYTANGNEKAFIRQKHLPLSYRKDFFDLQLQNLNHKV